MGKNNYWFHSNFSEVIDDGNLIFNELMYDESNGHYNANDGIFTSPLDGFYQFELNLVTLSEIYTIGIYLNDAIGLCLQFLII